jgi:hypothetical protein
MSRLKGEHHVDFFTGARTHEGTVRVSGSRPDPSRTGHAPGAAHHARGTLRVQRDDAMVMQMHASYVCHADTEGSPDPTGKLPGMALPATHGRSLGVYRRRSAPRPYARPQAFRRARGFNVIPHLRRRPLLRTVTATQWTMDTFPLRLYDPRLGAFPMTLGPRECRVLVSQSAAASGAPGRRVHTVLQARTNASRRSGNLMATSCVLHATLSAGASYRECRGDSVHFNGVYRVSRNWGLPCLGLGAGMVK